MDRVSHVGVIIQHCNMHNDFRARVSITAEVGLWYVQNTLITFHYSMITTLDHGSVLQLHLEKTQIRTKVQLQCTIYTVLEIISPNTPIKLI